MSILRIAGIALITVALSTVVRSLRPEYGIYIPICASAVIFIYAVSELCGLVQTVQARLSALGLDNAYITLLYKSLGIAYTAQLAADISRDAGESAVASKVELFGKVAVFALCVPVMLDVLDMVDEVIALI